VGSEWVSRLHGMVSRDLFKSLFPRWPMDEVPVGSVTNGVHMTSWDLNLLMNLDRTLRKRSLERRPETVEQDICKASDDTLWQLRIKSRSNLVNFTRKRFERQLRISGQSSEMVKVRNRCLTPMF